MRAAGVQLGRSVAALRAPIGQLRCFATTSSAKMDDRHTYKFGLFPIPGSHVFATTELSYGFVNLKPVVPGHVLVSPKRSVKRFADLTPDEVTDLWLLAQRVGRVVEPHYGAGSLTLAIQDGPLAGQTVPHVHIHVLPRKAGDFAKNDEVYDAIDREATEYDTAMSVQSSVISGEKLDLDEERKVRTHQEMAEEAAVLRGLLIA